MRCDVTCTPDTSSSTYTNGTFQARPTPPNTRAFSSPFAAHAEQDASSSSVTVGSASFNYAVPILSLPGRNGLDVNLTLYYNSRTWTIDNTNGRASFNADRDFPSYGFRLGYGSIEVSNSVYLLTEPDGARQDYVARKTLEAKELLYSDFEEAQQQDDPRVDGRDAREEPEVGAVKLGGAIEDLTKGEWTQVGFHGNTLCRVGAGLAGY